MLYSTSLLSTEFIKVKNSFVIWITIVASMCIPVLLFLAFALEIQEHLPKGKENPWEDFLNRACNGCCFFSPITAVLMIGLIVNIEHDANGWKHMLVLPQSRAHLFLNKLLVIVTTIIVFLVLYFGLTLLFGYGLSAYRVELLFSQHAPDLITLVSFIGKFMISLLGIISIQYWLSFRLRNLAAVLTIGILGQCLGLLLRKWEYISLFPYASPYLMINYKANPGHILEPYHWISLAAFVLFTILSYRDFKRNFNGH